MTPSTNSPRDLRLHSLPFLAKLGLTCLTGVVAIGMWASLEHLEDHHENRDGEPGLSSVDLEAAYHGIDQPSAFVRSLERGHPEGLAEDDRAELLVWLRGDRISEDYDSLELGDLAPAELIDAACLSCHSKSAAEPVTPTLDYWDDVEAIAFSRQLDATPAEIVVLSLHTHALSLATLCLILGLLPLATRFPAVVRALPLGLGGPGLLLDLSAWWLARESAAWVTAIVIGGGLFALSSAISCALILLELWLPSRRE